MSFVKISLCLAFVAICVSATDLGSRKAERMSLPIPAEKPKDTRASLLNSNLPDVDQEDILRLVEWVYDNLTDANDKATYIQDFLQKKYPSLVNNVIVGYRGTAYYQNYYIFLYANYDYILAFGLNA